MKNEIVNKLNNIILSEKAVVEEAKIVYMMIETRKLIEHLKTNNYIVQFYCDWVVHTEKDRVTPTMKKIIRKIYSSVEKQIKNPNQLSIRSTTTDFAYFKDFKVQLGQLYEANSIDCDWLGDKNEWITFISQLVKVLENQPINNPIPEVKKIIFLPANDDCVIYRIEFVNQIKGYSHYHYMNAY